MLKYLQKPASRYAKPFVQLSRVVLTGVYGGLIYGQLLKSKTKMPFSTMEQLSHLIHTNKLALVLTKQTAAFATISHSMFPAYQRIRIAHLSGRNEIMFTNTLSELTESMLDNQNLVSLSFCEWALQDLIKPYKDKLVVITDQKAPLTWSGMPIRTGWQHSGLLKWSMIRIDETGIFWKFFKKYQPLPNAPGAKPLTGERVFKLTDLIGALWVLVYGYGPGIVLLFLEIWWSNLDAQDSLFATVKWKLLGNMNEM